MIFLPGQGLLIKGQFANGEYCKYERPFLIISVSNTTVSALNVSSLKGKEKKLMIASNKRIFPYKPPFILPSFVKLDELYHFELFPQLDQFLVMNGKGMPPESINNVITNFHQYSSRKSCKEVNITKNTIIQLNTQIQVN